MIDRIRNIYLVLSQKCNLSCSYCYAKGGDFGQESRLMDSGTMRRALERLVPYGDGTVVVSFFGGEPLLNFGLMQETVAYGKTLARERGVQLLYALTTNGTVMTDEIVRFLKDNVAYMAVSLDGDADINDRERKFRNGQRRVHDAVVDTIGKLRDAGIAFGLRGTVTEASAPELGRTARYLAGLGAESVRMAPAFHAGGWRHDAWERLRESSCALELDALARIVSGEAPKTGEHVFKVLLNAVGGERRSYPCAAGMAVVAVAANGDVYPCDHFIGIEAFRMGNVHDAQWPGERFHAVRERLMHNSVEHRGKCSQCDVRHICGGECHVHSLLGQGDIGMPSPQHCALTRSLSRRLLDEVGRITASAAGERRLRDFINGA